MDRPGSPDDPGVPDGVPDFTGPAPAEPEFLPCYRHRDRTTGITCQRCHRPICMQCMHEAPVGFLCPDCSGEDPRGSSGGGSGRGRARRPGGPRTVPPRSSSGSGSGLLTRLDVASAPATWGIVAVCVLVGLADLVSRNFVTGWLALSPLALEAQQWWRLVTFAVTSAGLFGLAINALVLVLIGRTLEPLLGTWRMVAIFLTACLVGGALFAVVAQGPAGITGMNTGTIGLIAASAAVKLRAGHDIRFDLVLLGLLIVLSLVTGFSSFYWLAQIGGVLGGGGSALIMVFAPGRRSSIQVAGLATVWVVCLAAVGLGLILA